MGKNCCTDGVYGFSLEHKSQNNPIQKEDDEIVIRENGVEDRFRLRVLKKSKDAGLPYIYSGIFDRKLKIDDIPERGIVVKDSMTEDIIDIMLATLREMTGETVYLRKRDERELTCDIQGRISGLLNFKYGIQIAREYTIGRSKKTIGESDLYFFRTKHGIKEPLYILESKFIQNFVSQYRQLMGYLNPYFKAGVTLSINKDMEWEEAFDFIYKKLKELQDEGGDFAPISIFRKEGSYGTIYIKSEHIVPETGKIMPIYHLVMQLSDRHRHEIAIKARS